MKAFLFLPLLSLLSVNPSATRGSTTEVLLRTSDAGTSVLPDGGASASVGQGQILSDGGVYGGDGGVAPCVVLGACNRRSLTSATLGVCSNAGLSGRMTLAIQNCGPNQIFCGIGSCPREGAGFHVAPFQNNACGLLALDVQTSAVVMCVVASANQVADAGTIITELGQ